MKSPRGINEWINWCLSYIQEVYNFNPKDKDIDTTDFLPRLLESMHKSARDFGYKNGYVEGVGKASNYKSKEYLQNACYTDENGDIIIDRETFNPMAVDFKEDLNKY